MNDQTGALPFELTRLEGVEVAERYLDRDGITCRTLFNTGVPHVLWGKAITADSTDSNSR